VGVGVKKKGRWWWLVFFLLIFSFCFWGVVVMVVMVLCAFFDVTDERWNVLVLHLGFVFRFFFCDVMT